LWRSGDSHRAASVALALLSAASDIEPEWDRMMLVSIPGGKIV